MLDSDLATLYGVTTSALKQAVRRNLDRFPEDFLLELTPDEADELSRSQFVILKRGENIKFRPFAFTQEGVAMLSGVLRSKQAVHANIAIMRAFVQQRELLKTYVELARKIGQLERGVVQHDQQLKSIFDALRKLMEPPPRPRKKIGFRGDES